MNSVLHSTDLFFAQPDQESMALRWIVAQEGSRQRYAVPLAFHQLKRLRMLYVDIWCRHGRSLLKRGPKGCRALAGRFNGEIPSDRVVSFGLSSLWLRTVQHFQQRRQSPGELGASFCRFGRSFALKVRRHLETVEMDPRRDTFFCFDTNSLEVLELLKKRGVFTVLDQVDPGRLHDELVIEETERWPGWQEFPGQMPQSYWDRRQEEWRIADVVMVNSEWSEQAIIRQGVPKDKIIVVPLAIDLSNEDIPSPVEARGALKVLWMGNVVLGKGIQYLVEAARLVARRNIQFQVAGPLGISPDVVRKFPPNMKLLGRVTRDRVAEVYRQSHVFVLPTISDGFAITQLEAMAHALPVVTTPNCGRVVTHGMDGLIVPARDSQALADALAQLDADRELVREMSRNALRTIRKYDLPSNAQLICDLTIKHRRRRRVATPAL